MFRSIRWTFLGWNTILLLLVLCGFGATLFHLVRHARLEEIDAELKGPARFLKLAVLRQHSRRPRDGRRGPRARGEMLGKFDADGDGELSREERTAARTRRRHPFEGFEEVDEQGPGSPDDPEGSAAEKPRRGLRRAGRHDFERREELLRRFGGEIEGSPYFVVWKPDGAVLREMNAPPEIPYPELPRETQGPQEITAEASYVRQRGVLREVILPGPRGSQIVVGRSIRKELDELTQLTWMLAISGIGVLVVGLAGGWLLAKRAIRPIEAISTAAESISASNLSQRIEIEATKNELGTLAGVLNTTFARLQAAFEQQTRFTADASHELRTPVSVILAQTEMALGKERTGDEYRHVLEACLRASKRMKGLIDGLLTLARTDAADLKLETRSFHLSTLVEECALLLAPLAEERRITTTLDLQPTEVTADFDRVSQVITNLLSNAINYNREGGSVRVSLTSHNHEAVLSVSDTGLGIPAKDRSEIFERFYRVDKARSRKLGGSGLGLAISKILVEAHGGTISFTSELEQGTTFTVRLPKKGGP